MVREIPKLFGTSGIRGKIGSDITLEVAVNVGMAIATYAGGKGSKIVLGYDSRTSNVMIEMLLLQEYYNAVLQFLKWEWHLHHLLVTQQ